MWRDEVIAARENNLVAAELFRRINHVAKKRDSIHIPTISNPTTSEKRASTQVTLTAVSETDNVITLDKHYQVSYLFEDFAMVQSAYDLRKYYTQKAGYALALQIDDDVAALEASISDTTPDHWIEGDGTDAAKGSSAAVSLTQDGLLVAIRLLDEANVPEEGRFLIASPKCKAQLLSIDAFTLYQNIGRTKEIQKGQFGEIYGVKVFVTNNLHSDNSVNVSCLGHPDAIVSVIQKDVRVQAQYLQDYLATLLTCDVIYGVKILRTDHAVVITTG